MFLAGLPYFELLTDHHPLIPILRLYEIENPRMRMKIMPYNFKAIWHKGVTNQALDALSRSPVSFPTPQELLAESNEDFTMAEIRSLHQDGLESNRKQELCKYANFDKAYKN